VTLSESLGRVEIGGVHLFAYDKRLHFGCGVSICLLVGIATTPIVGLVAAALAGLGKEVYDAVTGSGTPELPDFAATVVGGLVGAAWLAMYW